MKEFGTLKNANSSKSNVLDIVDGTLKLCSKYEGFAADPESTRHAKNSIFLESLENREVIYVAEEEGV